MPWKQPRRSRALAAGLTGLIALPDDDEEIGPALDDAVARLWDAHWLAACRGPFSWMLFTEWWIARRWLLPRGARPDVTHLGAVLRSPPAEIVRK